MNDLAVSWAVEKYAHCRTPAPEGAHKRQKKKKKKSKDPMTVLRSPLFFGFSSSSLKDELVTCINV